MINSSSPDESSLSLDRDNFTVISGPEQLLLLFSLSVEVPDGPATAVSGSEEGVGSRIGGQGTATGGCAIGVSVDIAATRLLLPQGLLLVCVSAAHASSLRLIVVVVVVVATIVARELKFIVISKCFF